MPNQTPEQIARDIIDKQLKACGWVIQSKKNINLNAGIGIAVTEYQTEVGPADYILFVNKTNAVCILTSRIFFRYNLKCKLLLLNPLSEFVDKIN